MWTENHKFAVKKQMLPVTKRNEKSPASGLDADCGKGTYDMPLRGTHNQSLFSFRFAPSRIFFNLTCILSPQLPSPTALCDKTSI